MFIVIMLNISFAYFLVSMLLFTISLSWASLCSMLWHMIKLSVAQLNNQLKKAMKLGVGPYLCKQVAIFGLNLFLTFCSWL
jgi:hypothetical protein